MKKYKKKSVMKIKVPRPRNLITKAMCSDRHFQGRTIASKKKMLKPFDWRKELDE